MIPVLKRFGFVLVFIRRSPLWWWSFCIAELLARYRYRSPVLESHDDDRASVPLDDAGRADREHDAAPDAYRPQEHDATTVRELHFVSPLILRPSLRALSRISISTTADAETPKRLANALSAPRASSERRTLV